MPGIIKAGTPLSSGKTEQVTPYFHLEDFEKRGERFLQEVRQQAAQLLSEAQSQVASLRESARVEGRQAAVQQARQEMQVALRERMTQLEPTVDSVLSQLREEIEAWRLEWENRTVQLAVGIAQRICRRELANHPQLVLSQIEAALRLAGNDDQLELRVHPDDLAGFGPAIDQLIGRLSEVSRAQVVADPEIQVGGCLLRTKYGSIDAQIEAQLARIDEELRP